MAEPSLGALAFCQRGDLELAGKMPAPQGRLRQPWDLFSGIIHL